MKTILSLLLIIWCGATMAQVTPYQKSSSENQFVLFDVMFDYSKADADNSKPNKSHYYVKDEKINPFRPTNWNTPVDFRNGTVHIRLEVIKKPEGKAPTKWTLCYIPNKGQGNN